MVCEMIERRLFHLVCPADLASWQAGPWAPPSLAAEGFVHLSFADQLAGTLRKWYSDAAEAVLLEVDAGEVADALRIEPSRGGAMFPHVHRAMNRTDFTRRWDLSRGGGGGDFELPGLGDSPGADDPPGAAFV
ncbi:MAG: dihydroorotate dehydrogenase [Planctomycetes bacterium]|nr:dihydroorotate dehydrogenase [Planctomycetota bacterium]